MPDKPNKMNISVTNESQGRRPGEIQRRRSKVKRLLTLDRMILWIKSHKFDEFTTQGLIEMASKYPNTALPSFKQNFSLMVARVRQKRKEEQGGTYVRKEERKPTEIIPSNLDDAFKRFNSKTKEEILYGTEEEKSNVKEVSFNDESPLDDWQNEAKS